MFDGNELAVGGRRDFAAHHIDAFHAEFGERLSAFVHGNDRWFQLDGRGGAAERTLLYGLANDSVLVGNWTL